MEVWAFLLIAWIAIRFLSGGRCSTDWNGRHRSVRGHTPWPERDARLMSGRATAPPTKIDRKPALAETTEERLRREYVDGTLTVEQYERELDALYRGRA